MMKECSKCGKVKALDLFRKHPGRKNGVAGDCKECFNEYKRQWRSSNRDKQQAQQQRDRLREYGLTQEEYDLLQVAQGGICPICVRACDDWHIDHNHETGEVRGLLCRDCNWALGHFSDNAARMTRAQAYLEQTPWDALKVPA